MKSSFLTPKFKDCGLKMEIRLTCPACSKRYRLSPSLVGKFLKCKRCGTFIEIREDEAHQPVSSAERTGKRRPRRTQNNSPGESERAAEPIDIDDSSVSHELFPAEPGASWMSPEPPEPRPTRHSELKPAETGVGEPPISPTGSIPEHADHQSVNAGARPFQGDLVNDRFTSTDLAIAWVGAFVTGLAFLALLLPLLPDNSPGVSSIARAVRLPALLIALVAAAIVAVGLRKRKVVAGVGGILSAATAIALFLTASRTGDDVAAETLALARESSSRSTWMDKFPGWDVRQSGVRTNQQLRVRGPNPSNRWSQIDIEPFGCSVKIPLLEQPPVRLSEIKIGNRELAWGIVQAVASNGLLYSVRYFSHPDVAIDSAQLLNDTELALRNLASGDGYRKQASDVINGLALEASFRCRVAGQPVHVHQQIVVRGPSVYVLFVSGPAEDIPGEASKKFMSAFRFQEPWRVPGQVTGERYGGRQVALDPYAGDAAPADELPPSPPSPPQSHAISLRVSPAERDREDLISNRLHLLRLAVEEQMGQRAAISFPESYLGPAINDNQYKRTFLVHPGKRPMIGADVTFAVSDDRQLARMVAPLFSRDKAEDESYLVQPGFGIVGICANVVEFHGEPCIAGLRFIIQKVTDDGFDPVSESFSQWYGEPPPWGDDGYRVQSEGRPVYGLWHRRNPEGLLTAIGLILEADWP